MEWPAKYLVSRQSIRQALGILERDGLIHKIHGSGSYVSDKLNLPKKTMRIAVIVANIDSYVISGILSGIEAICTQNHYSIQLMSTSNSIAKERNILQSLLVHLVDGILVEGTKRALPNPNLSFYRELAAQNKPIIFLNSIYPELSDGADGNILSVTMDDYSGVYDLTMSLIQEGHCSIGGVFSGEDLQGVRRYSGFIDALAQSEFGLEDRHVLLLNTSEIGARESSSAVLNLVMECTAIVCQNNEVADHVATFVKTLAGKTRMLVLFNGSQVSDRSELQVRSLMLPKEKLGQIAAEKVIAMINGTPEESLVMPRISST
jgi:GntR family transcriptional regulator of arabinose operon